MRLSAPAWNLLNRFTESPPFFTAPFLIVVAEVNLGKLHPQVKTNRSRFTVTESILDGAGYLQ
jgi:hypothetical protein